jgi:hypothetical protein
MDFVPFKQEYNGIYMGHKLFAIDEMINDDMIRVKKPFNLYRKSVYEVYYGEKNNQILIQTPDVMFQRGYNTASDGSFNVDIAINDTWVCGILERIFKKVCRVVGKNTLDGKNCIQPVKECGHVRLKNTDHASIYVFDSDATRISLANVSRGDKVQVIFHVEGLHVYDSGYILYLKLLQVKKMSVKACLFVTPGCQSPSKGVGTKDLDIETLGEKYKKMLSLGIPMAAVKQKMFMDGALPKPQGLPPPGLKHTPPIAAMLAQIKLRQVTVNPSQKTYIPKGVDAKRVPSLDEIQNALKNLRNVNPKKLM